MRMRVKLAIVRSGRLQYELARELGVPDSTLSKYVRGYGSLRPEQEQRLADLLGLQEETNKPRRGHARVNYMQDSV